ncbi:thioredoxin family protein [Campylobacter sp.]|uniref:thioredoxin family protein n=1 Tax=Campylobacter sp. TaxID=205 RepID=UPI00270DF163|nr:thioredoxin family protein [Campylobacter sp.]
MKIFKILVAALAFATLSFAGEAFDKAKFDKLVADGKDVVVHIHAPWCGTCKKQDNVLSDIAKTSGDKVSFLTVDFDSQKDVVKGFGANDRSVIIVFKEGKEVSRTFYETNAGKIKEQLKPVL